MAENDTRGPTGDRSRLEATTCCSISEQSKNQLNDFVEQSGGGTMFHRYGWLAAVEDGLDSESRHVLVSKEGNPVGFLPNVAADLPLPGAVGDRTANALPLEVV